MKQRVLSYLVAALPYVTGWRTRDALLSPSSFGALRSARQSLIRRAACRLPTQHLIIYLAMT